MPVSFSFRPMAPVRPPKFNKKKLFSYGRSRVGLLYDKRCVLPIAQRRGRAILRARSPLVIPSEKTVLLQIIRSATTKKLPLRGCRLGRTGEKRPVVCAARVPRPKYLIGRKKKREKTLIRSQKTMSPFLTARHRRFFFPQRKRNTLPRATVFSPTATARFSTTCTPLIDSRCAVKRGRSIRLTFLCLVLFCDDLGPYRR